jgi:hypothetical protein
MPEDGVLGHVVTRARAAGSSKRTSSRRSPPSRRTSSALAWMTTPRGRSSMSTGSMGDLASRGFDPRAQFSAFLRTLRWNRVRATVPSKVAFATRSLHLSRTRFRLGSVNVGGARCLRALNTRRRATRCSWRTSWLSVGPALILFAPSAVAAWTSRSSRTR